MRSSRVLIWERNGWMSDQSMYAIFRVRSFFESFARRSRTLRETEADWETMHEAEILIAGLLVAVAGLSALARRLAIPYPIVLVLGGALFGFVPGVPTVNLNPDVVLVVFLPPLLYGAAFFANLGDIRANLR